MVKPVRLVFFASGRGSNMQAVLDACDSGVLNAVGCAVISNNSESEALERARRAGIPAFHLSSKTHPDPVELDGDILSVLQENQAHLVILAGYMKLLGPRTLGAYRDRVINIHPALLPHFGGPGMYGMHVHEAVLAAGEKETGVTIHLVDEAYDQGVILAQARVPVLPEDTSQVLASRVLAREHTFLVETLQRIISGEIPLL